jgi:hypothetical protein
MKVRDSDVLVWVQGQRKSNTGHVWAAGVHHVMARARLVRIFNLRTPLFLECSNLFSGRGKPRITENTDTESADTGARLYNAFALVYGPYLIWLLLLVTSCSYIVTWISDQLNGRLWYDSMRNEPARSGSQ